MSASNGSPERISGGGLCARSRVYVAACSRSRMRGDKVGRSDGSAGSEEGSVPNSLKNQLLDRLYSCNSV